MKKLGILTFHYVPNFGAALQSYALCNALSGIGVKNELIDYRNGKITDKELVFKASRNPVKTFKRLLFWKYRKKSINACQSFVKERCSVSDVQYDPDTVSSSNPIYDAFMVGSDQVWNLRLTGNDFSYFLDFVDSGRQKYSYGSSADGAWSGHDSDSVKKELKSFKSISVRESGTAEYIRNNFGLDCINVCDPTLLLKKEDWDKFTYTPPRIKNYVIVYFAHKGIVSAAKQYAQKNKKKVLVMTESGISKYWGTKGVRILSPYDWLSYIKYSEAVFTNSYHGCLFALQFNRPLWTDNPSSRMLSVFKRLNLTGVFIGEDPNFKNRINYAAVNNEIEKFRQESIAYLKKIAEDIK